MYEVLISTSAYNYVLLLSTEICSRHGTNMQFLCVKI